MASNLALDARRGDIFYISYNDPKVIVELNENENHPLYDPRVKRSVVRETVASIKLRGQEVPAEGYKQPGLRDGKQVVTITKGRGRWKAINVAWKEMLAEGEAEQHLPPFRLIVKRYVSDLDAYEAAIIENVHREDEDPLSKARKLQTYLNKIGDTDEMRERARVIFNLRSMDAMEELLKQAVSATPETKKALSDGVFTKAAAKKIVKASVDLNPDQQAQVLKDVETQIRDNNGKRKKKAAEKEVEAAISKVTGRTVQPKMMSRKAIKDLLAAKEEKLAEMGGPGVAAQRLEAQIEVIKQILGEAQAEKTQPLLKAVK